MKFIKLVVIIFSTFSACTIKDNYQQPSHKTWLDKHTYAVGQASLMLKDTSRNRPLKTEIWYPTTDTTGANVTAEYPFQLPRTSKNAKSAAGRFPLILFSHGTGGNRISQMWLAAELAGNGFVVAAVDHYGNTLDNKVPENFVKVWDRPLDLSFLLDHLLRDELWSKSIQADKIGVAGFSLGGYTAIALAGAKTDYALIRKFADSEQGESEFTIPELGDIRNLITPEIIRKGNTEFTNLKDERISAFAVMTPALGQAFKSEEQFRFIETPILIIGAENDKRTPVETNARHYHRFIRHSQYLELEGEVGHYIFMNVAKDWLKRDAKEIFKDTKGINRKEIHQLVAKTILIFFDEHLRDNQ